MFLIVVKSHRGAQEIFAFSRKASEADARHEPKKGVNCVLEAACKLSKQNPYGVPRSLLQLEISMNCLLSWSDFSDNVSYLQYHRSHVLSRGESMLGSIPARANVCMTNATCGSGGPDRLAHLSSASRCT